MPSSEQSVAPGTATYEGWFSRILCSECEVTFDYEDDPSNGQKIECPDCHATLIVEGR